MEREYFPFEEHTTEPSNVNKMPFNIKGLFQGFSGGLVKVFLVLSGLSFLYLAYIIYFPSALIVLIGGQLFRSYISYLIVVLGLFIGFVFNIFLIHKFGQFIEKKRNTTKARIKYLFFRTPFLLVWSLLAYFLIKFFLFLLVERF